jgi:hypothetical protein
MNSHPPEVLAALVVRLRSEVGRAEYAWRRSVPDVGVEVHQLERDDVEAACNAGVLQIDRLATMGLARDAAWAEAPL